MGVSEIPYASFVSVMIRRNLEGLCDDLKTCWKQKEDCGVRCFLNLTF